MMKKSNKKGFTLVELIVVIAIMAILAAVLVPTVTSKIKDANESKAKSECSSIANAVQSDIVNIASGLTAGNEYVTLDLDENDNKKVTGAAKKTGVAGDFKVAFDATGNKVIIYPTNTDYEWHYTVETTKGTVELKDTAYSAGYIAQANIK